MARWPDYTDKDRAYNAWRQRTRQRALRQLTVLFRDEYDRLVEKERNLEPFDWPGEA